MISNRMPTQPETLMDNMIQSGFRTEATRDAKSINTRTFYAVDSVVDSYEEVLNQPGLKLAEADVTTVGDVLASAVDSALGSYGEVLGAAETKGLPVLFTKSESGLVMTNFGKEQAAEAVFPHNFLNHKSWGSKCCKRNGSTFEYN
jgi:hypothetical protein